MGSYTADGRGMPAALRLVPSELPLRTHLPISEGWTAELAVSCGL